MPLGYMEAPADVNYETEGQWRCRPVITKQAYRSIISDLQTDSANAATRP